MFWTAIVWGIGVSTGASVGMMCFVLMFSVFTRITKSEHAKNIEKFHERSHAALVKRNMLSREMIDHMSVIASAAERFEDSIDSKKS